MSPTFSSLRRSSRFVPLLVAAAAAGLPCAAWAEDPIATDRPDFVESSSVVGRGRLQIESGLSFERDAQPGSKTRTRSTPMLWRMGVSDAFELRVESDGFLRSRTLDTATGITDKVRGFGDASLGLKWHMQDGDEKTGSPSIAWLAHVDVDSGSQAFRGHGARPSLRMVAEWELPQDFSFGVMPGLVLDRRDDGGRFTAGILAATLGKEWSPKWKSFVEVAGQQLTSRRNGGSVVTFDAGASYLVTPSVQLDVSLARGLTRQSPDLSWGAGLSVRF